MTSPMRAIEGMADLREILQRMPTEAEIKRSMQPLLDHWAVKDHTNG